jgi:hypothetical protein
MPMPVSCTETWMISGLLFLFTTETLTWPIYTVSDTEFMTHCVESSERATYLQPE